MLKTQRRGLAVLVEWISRDLRVVEEGLALSGPGAEAGAQTQLNEDLVGWLRRRGAAGLAKDVRVAEDQARELKAAVA